MHTQAVSFVQNTYAEFQAFSDFSPKNKKVKVVVDDILSHINLWRQQGVEDALLRDPRVAVALRNLPDLSARAEVARETYWTECFLKLPELTSEAFKEFPYYDCYTHIVESEFALMDQYAPDATSIAFIGSGPLPMTVLMAAFKRPDMHFVCVDWDEVACRTAQKLVNKLGLSARVKIECSAAQSFVPAEGCFPIVACMIEHKEGAYKHYQDCGIQQFMVRNADGGCQFLYHPAPLPCPFAWDFIAKTPISDKRQVTTLLYKQRDLHD